MLWGTNLMGEGGFEPPKLKATDLQSAPFDHSGILPNTSYYKLNIIACCYGMSSTNGSRLEGWFIKDSNLGPTGYEPVALTN